MPYAIFRSGGKQFRAEPGKTLRIPSLKGEAGTTVEFSDVLLGTDGANNVRLGVPALSGAKVKFSDGTPELALQRTDAGAWSGTGITSNLANASTFALGFAETGAERAEGSGL